VLYTTDFVIRKMVFYRQSVSERSNLLDISWTVGASRTPFLVFVVCPTVPLGKLVDARTRWHGRRSNGCSV